MRFATLVIVFISLMASSCGLPDLPRPQADAPMAIEDARLAAEWQELAAPADGVRRAGCFSEHLGDAIRLNDSRGRVYSAWSQRRSEPISERLIRAERTSLAVARWVDRKARPFQADGIPIVCAEFVSMALTPPLPDAPLARPAAPFDAVDAAAIRDRIIAAYGESGFAGLAAEADAELARLGATPEYHCMTRHLIESLWRVAVLAPLHERRAAERQVGSTRELSELLVRLHLAALPEGAKLDRAAAPLQARGIPIICRDVPPIR